MSTDVTQYSGYTFSAALIGTALLFTSQIMGVAEKDWLLYVALGCFAVSIPFFASILTMLQRDMSRPS